MQNAEPWYGHSLQTETDLVRQDVDVATVSSRGAARWARGHPWIFRSDVLHRPAAEPGAVRVAAPSGRPLGWALWSPRSEISLRLLDRDSDGVIDAAWWRARIATAIARRAPLADVATGYRLVHGEADGCPSLVCDRYDRVLVVQLLSAGVERFRQEIIEALVSLASPDGILARNDPAVRSREGLPREVELLWGEVPRLVEIQEHGVRILAAPWDGQKTGAFLDQRENHALVGRVARGRVLDCFSYHGGFALHAARAAEEVRALDASEPALAHARENAARNELSNVAFVVADVFDALREMERARERFDTIVLDPPAFAKTRAALAGALRGYQEINLRAMRLLAPGGLLFTASCSHHLSRPAFDRMLAQAAGDSGRRLAVRTVTGQPMDHPYMLTMPESGYLKGALLEAME